MRKIIDVHTHIYPEAIAKKAVASIAGFYGIDTTYADGTIDSLIGFCRQAEVVKAVVHSVATSPRQVESINSFIAATAKEHALFLPFATLHPMMSEQEIKREYARIKELSMKGIKLHPDCQKFALDGQNAARLFGCLDGELPIMVHTGDPRYQFSNPNKMISVAKNFTHLRFVAAHFGGWSEWDETGGYRGLKNVWFDTSSTLAFVPPQRAREMIESLGEDRFMFGSDYPMWNAPDELRRLAALELPEDVEEKILYGNAARFFNL
jgi:predicted TIM-barrel fold metal-dependent hydrolase